MMRKQATFAAVAAIVLLAGLLVAISGGGATAAPPAAPTPVSVTQPVRTAPALYTLFPTMVITQDTRGTCRELGLYSVADIQVTIDMSGVNTTTGYLQFSNDLAGYVNGVNVISTAVDVSADMVQTPLFGRYACWYSDITTSTLPVTVTVSAWVK